MSSRREFFQRLGLGTIGVAATACGPETYLPDDLTEEVIPPLTARVQTTACAHCIVGCGYKVYTWPVTEAMGARHADSNALGVELGSPAGPWIGPEMVNRVLIHGEEHWVAVIPDWEAEAVNLGGDHTLGGSLAKRLFNPNAKVQEDRFQTPMLRLDGRLVPIPWDDALDLIAMYSQDVLAKPEGHLRWGMKTYSYQFYENTFAITRFVFDAIQTPCWAPHDRCANGSDAPGISDAGIDVFSASYQDWHDAEVIYVSGVSLHAAHGVLFSQWVRRGGATLIVVDPRRSVAADYALANGGMHLQLIPGTDTALQRGIARVIVENGWEDLDWIEEWVATTEDLELESSWRRCRSMCTFEEYVEDLLSDPDAGLDRVAAICGVPAEDIVEAARLLAAPYDDGSRPMTSMMLEKGNYWGHNYPSTGSFASLALLVGAGNRPGRMVSRAGGHQRGMVQAASYPTSLSPETFDGNPIELNLDRWAADGNLEFVWVMGCTWAGGGTARARELFGSLYAQTREAGGELSTHLQPDGPGTKVNIPGVLAAWRARAEAGGLVLVQSDLYPQPLTELADLVLPAAGWGEMEGTRMQGERRLRRYPRLTDPAGQSRPDWHAIAGVARRMGLSGFDWTGPEDLLDEALTFTSGVGAASALLDYAELRGTDVVTLLDEAGTTGLQCPLSLEDGELVETVRYHDAALGHPFSTSSGRAIFILSSWSDVESVQLAIRPIQDQLWIINRRYATNWSSLVEDFRVSFRRDLAPYNRLEIHPRDAAERGIEDGIPVVVTGNDGSFEAVAKVTDTVRHGVAISYFNFGGSPEAAANNVTSPEMDQVMNRYMVKLGRGRVAPT